MTTKTASAAPKTTADVRAAFEKKAGQGKSAKYVVLLIAAICAKISAAQTTLSVALQTARHGHRLLQGAQRLNELNAVDSVAGFLDNAFNIKAFDYTATLANGGMNDYLAITLDHVDKAKNPTTETVAAALAKFYGAGTVSAQKSMCVNALRALRAIEASSSPKSPIEQGPNFSAIMQFRDGYTIKRQPIAS